ncbi:hypothetical protein J6590_047642 [Homalodisca vitripennis]|nr:hypothetical protein J6590_047642 [Homalodisca vitripennis]
MNVNQTWRMQILWRNERIRGNYLECRISPLTKIASAVPLSPCKCVHAPDACFAKNHAEL